MLNFSTEQFSLWWESINRQTNNNITVRVVLILQLRQQCCGGSKCEYGWQTYLKLRTVLYLPLYTWQLMFKPIHVDSTFSLKWAFSELGLWSGWFLPRCWKQDEVYWRSTSIVLQKQVTDLLFCFTLGYFSPLLPVFSFLNLYFTILTSLGMQSSATTKISTSSKFKNGDTCAAVLIFYFFGMVSIPFPYSG